MEIWYDIASALGRMTCFGKAQEMLKYMSLNSNWDRYSVSRKYDVTDINCQRASLNPCLFHFLLSLKAMV